MKGFITICKKNKAWMAGYILLGVMIAFLTSCSAGYYQQLIDRFTDKTLTVGVIAGYGLVLAALCIGNYADEYPGRKLEHGIYLDMKIMALEKLRTIDYLSYQAMGTGTMLARVEQGAAAGRNILFGFWLTVIRELVPSILFSMWFILRINRRAALAVLLGYAVVFAVTNLLLKRLYQWKERILNQEERLSHYLTRGFMELVVFRVYRRFDFEIEKAKEARNRIVSSKIHMTMVHEAFFAIFALLVTLMKIGILIYAWQKRTVTVGEAIALITLIEHAYTPVAIFNVLFVQYRLDRAAYARLDALLNEPDEKRLTEGKRLTKLSGEIRIHRLSFEYKGRSIIRNCSCTIQSGERIALVGESGSGKSTLLKLIAGLLRPGSGQILAGGQDLSDICLEDYYQYLSYVPQESPVFDGTLRENLVFDDPVPDQRMIEVLEHVCLKEWLEGLPEGLETRLGERGTAVSGGERQRLALARLWFRKSSVILLDEATSAMDNLTEELVMKEVLRAAGNSTVIAVAHRLSSVRNFDRILLMRQGRIFQEGSFEQLLAESDYFRELYRAGQREPGN